MLRFLKRWWARGGFWGRDPGHPPVLVRLRTPNGFAEGPVELQATWHPSGTTATLRVSAAQGLCVVPWNGSRRVDLRLSHATHRGQVALYKEDVELGGTHDVWLTDTV